MEKLFWKIIIFLKRKKTFVRIYKVKGENYKIEIEKYELLSRELEKILENVKIPQYSKNTRARKGEKLTQKERTQLEEIEQKLKQYLKAKEKTTESILNILKIDCSLYKELKEKAFKCKKQFLYEGKSDYREIFDAIETLIEKEKSNLQIVNHS